MVWKKIPRAEAVKRGWNIIKTKWLDINKGDLEQPDYRSRFVGKEFRQDDGMEGLFAATPPLESLRSLISDAATTDTPNKVIKIMDVDHNKSLFMLIWRNITFVVLPTLVSVVLL